MQVLDEAAGQFQRVSAHAAGQLNHHEHQHQEAARLADEIGEEVHDGHERQRGHNGHRNGQTPVGGVEAVKDVQAQQHAQRLKNGDQIQHGGLAEPPGHAGLQLAAVILGQRIHQAEGDAAHPQGDAHHIGRHGVAVVLNGGHLLLRGVHGGGEQIHGGVAGVGGLHLVRRIAEAGLQGVGAVIQLIQTVAQLSAAGEQLVGAVRDLACAVGQLVRAAHQGGVVADQRPGAVGEGGGTGGQRGGAVRQTPGTGGQRIAAGEQALGARIQRSAAGGQRVGAVSELRQAAVQLRRAADQHGGALRLEHRAALLGLGNAAAQRGRGGGQLAGAVLDLGGAAGQRIQSGAGLGQAVGDLACAADQSGGARRRLIDTGGIVLHAVVQVAGALLQGGDLRLGGFIQRHLAVLQTVGDLVHALDRLGAAGVVRLGRSQRLLQRIGDRGGILGAELAVLHGRSHGGGRRLHALLRAAGVDQVALDLARTGADGVRRAHKGLIGAGHHAVHGADHGVDPAHDLLRTGAELRGVGVVLAHNLGKSRIQLLRAAAQLSRAALELPVAALELADAALNAAHAAVQRRSGLGERHRGGVELRQTRIQRGHIVVHLLRAADQRGAAVLDGLNAAVQGLGALGQRPGAVIQGLNAVLQGLGAVVHLLGAAVQGLRAVVQGLGAVIHRADAVHIAGQTLGQLLAAVHKGQGAVGQRLKSVGHGGVAVLQLDCAILKLTGAVGSLLHAVADDADLVIHGLHIGLGNALPDGGLNGLHGRLTHLGGDVVGAGVGLIAELHLLRRVAGQAGGVGGEVLWDGDDHVVIPIGQPLPGVLAVHKAEIQRAVVLQLIDHFLADVQRLSFIIHRPVVVHHRHGQLIHVSIGIPHGAEEQRRVNRGDGDDRDHHDQHQLVFHQMLPFIFQHLMILSFPIAL